MATKMCEETAIAVRVVVDYEHAEAANASGSVRNMSAYVVGVEAIAELQESARLMGVNVSESDAMASGNAPVLRLAMEEVAVGVSHGFLALVMDEQRRADAISDALRALLTRTKRPDAEDHLTIDEQSATRVRVFADLWQRGHFVAFGSKFGVDFLVYEGDPRTCHSFAMVVVRRYAASFTTTDIVAHCRVAKMVKKQFLLASDVDEQIMYLSLEHAVLAAARTR